MKERTPQEWADFLEMKIACFKTGFDTYQYIAIDINSYPFSMSWLQYLEELNLTKEPNDFYNKNKWYLTKILAENKYDTIFKPNTNGSIIYLQDLSNNKHQYLKGEIEKIDVGYVLPIKLKDWDKKIYIPKTKK